MRKSIFYSVTLLLFLLVLAGCGKLERKGTPPENTPPQVYFSNIPPESTYFSQNPRIFWFGTDIDGFIVAYQYVVVMEDSLMSFGGLEQLKSFLHDIPPDSSSWVNQTTLRDIPGFHVPAAYGGHQQNVSLFADMDPNVYTPQYLLLRAVDNNGGVSNVISQLYFRNNHRPEAFIEVSDDFLSQVHFCLEETTATWKGINISWSGLDTVDYPDPRYQPKFKFKWELVGPFEAQPTPQTVDTNKVLFYSQDSVLVVGEWKKSRWVSDNSHVFSGLVNYPDSGHGWYQLRLRAQDDASVCNDIATTLNFRIIKPTFRYSERNRRTILVVDATIYGGVDGGPPIDTTVGLVKPFFRNAMNYLTQEGVCDEWRLWYDPKVKPEAATKASPSKDIMSRFDLILMVNVGSATGITITNRDDLQDYLNIGGRVWTIGLNNYSVVVGPRYGMVDDFWIDYFGISEARAPGWGLLESDSLKLDFIKAQPFGLWSDLPVMELNIEACHLLKGYKPDVLLRKFGERGVPWVCHQVISNTPDFVYRIPYERRMLSYGSYYGALAETSNKPCGLNFIGPTFRTVDFSFPINLMKNDAPDYSTFQVMKRVVEWFWEDLP
jgi:hypothetical protein